MMAETKKMLDPKIKLTATCVRVPVFIGHSEAVNVELEKPITVEEATPRRAQHPAVSSWISARTAANHAARVGRRGPDLYFAYPRGRSVKNGLSLWVVSDNLRKGAALNAVQIAEALINRGLLTAKRKAA